MDRQELRELNLSIASLHEADDVYEYEIDRDRRIEFPRGFLRRLSQYKSFIPFVQNDILKDKIAHHMMHRDTLHWLWLKTDIAISARKMVTKFQLINLAVIVEGIAKHLVPEMPRRRDNMYERIDKIHDDALINEATCTGLKELWETRRAIHLHLTNVEENVRYTNANYIAWHRTVSEFISQLQENID